MFGDILGSIINAFIPSLVQAAVQLINPPKAPNITMPSFAGPALNPTAPAAPAGSTPGLQGAGSPAKPSAGLNFTGGFTGGAPLNSGGQQPGAPSTGFTTLSNSYYNPNAAKPTRPGFQGI